MLCYSPITTLVVQYNTQIWTYSTCNYCTMSEVKYNLLNISCSLSASVMDASFCLSSSSLMRSSPSPSLNVASSSSDDELSSSPSDPPSLNSPSLEALPSLACTSNNHNDIHYTTLNTYMSFMCACMSSFSSEN